MLRARIRNEATSISLSTGKVGREPLLPDVQEEKARFGKHVRMGINIETFANRISTLC